MIAGITHALHLHFLILIPPKQLQSQQTQKHTGLVTEWVKYFNIKIKLVIFTSVIYIANAVIAPRGFHVV